MSDRVVLMRDRLISGAMTMEEFARTLIRMDGSSPMGPCLREDQGARLPARAPTQPKAQSLFDAEAAEPSS